MKLIKYILCLSLCLISGCSKPKPVITIAYANSLLKPMQTIINDFSDTYGYQVNQVINSSESIFIQIQHGLELDLFFSADLNLNKELAYPYESFISNSLVIASNEYHSFSLNQTSIDEVMIVEPSAAPIGYYAEEWFKHLGFEYKLTGKSLNALQQYLVNDEVKYIVTYQSEAYTHQNNILLTSDKTYPLGVSKLSDNDVNEVFIAYIKEHSEVFEAYGFNILS